MALIPKARFKWREPKGFVEERDCHDGRTGKWWHKALGVAIVIALMMPLWLLANFIPQRDPPRFEIALLLAFLLGLFLVYVLPLMNRFCPSEIKLTDKMLVMLRGNSHRSARWRDIKTFCFGENGGFQFLEFKLRKGGELKLGLDSTVRIEDVRLFLVGVGVSTGNSEQD